LREVNFKQTRITAQIDSLKLIEAKLKKLQIFVARKIQSTKQIFSEIQLNQINIISQINALKLIVRQAKLLQKGVLG
jgi:hypothetical protein